MEYDTDVSIVSDGGTLEAGVYEVEGDTYELRKQEHEVNGEQIQKHRVIQDGSIIGSKTVTLDEVFKSGNFDEVYRKLSGEAVIGEHGGKLEDYSARGDL
jgi:hypothetical protein